MAKKSDRIVFVLGMHRSGTSAITKALEVLDVDLGDNLLPAKSANAKGFFEDSVAVDIDDEILMHYAQYWDSLTPLPPDFAQQAAMKKHVAKAVALLKSRIGDRPFGLKDPRMSKVLPVWLEAARQLKLKPVFVIANRNPLSVVESLSKRDAFTPAKSAMLWVHYQLSSLQLSAGYDRVIVDFDLMLQDPLKQLTRMARELSLPLDPKTELAQSYAREFLDTSMLSSRHELGDLAVRIDIPAGVAALYSLLLDASRDKVPLENALFAQKLNALYPHLFDGALHMIDEGLEAQRQLTEKLNWQTAFIDDLKTSKMWKVTQSYRRLVSKVKGVPPAEF